VDFLLNQSEYQVCYTDEIWIRKGIRVNSKKNHQKYSGHIYQYCLPLCIISPSSILIKQDLVDDVGLFDVDIPACEDYDYWLRLSSRYPIYFMKKKLITKRGGHPDQLSQKYPVMDRFRIQSLIKMLEYSNLNSMDYKSTLNMLIKKSKIIKNGCYKRGKEKEGDYYDSLIKKYSQNAFPQKNKAIPH